MGCLTVFTFLFIRIWILLSAVHGIPRFTRKPPTIQYASSGGTARLVWDYHVDNKIKEFDPYSPEWYLYNTSGVKVPIGTDDGFNGWSFVIHGGCPPGLRERVIKDDTATLVISNVTTNDSGVYGCALVCTSWSPIKSEVRLIVTDPPRFTTSLSPTTDVTEGSSLNIQCAAFGDPLPNVTWARIWDTNVSTIIDVGLGKAVLAIVNITRLLSGKYECRAANNHNGDAIAMQTEVSVKFLIEASNVSISEIKTTTAVIKWLISPNDEIIPVIDFKIQINTKPPREMITKNTYQAIDHLTENTTYVVKVNARNELGYGKGSVAEFTTKIQDKPTTKDEQISEQRDFKVSTALVGIICLVGIVFLVFTIGLAIFLKKRYASKGKKQTHRMNCPDRVVPGTVKEEPQTFEEVTLKKTTNIEEQESVPIYAEIDKNKKRRPGEIFYAELSDLKLKEEAFSSIPIYIPPSYPETKYADIVQCQNKYGGDN